MEITKEVIILTAAIAALLVALSYMEKKGWYQKFLDWRDDMPIPVWLAILILALVIAAIYWAGGRGQDFEAIE